MKGERGESRRWSYVTSIILSLEEKQTKSSNTLSWQRRFSNHSSRMPASQLPSVVLRRSEFSAARYSSTCAWLLLKIPKQNWTMSLVRVKSTRLSGSSLGIDIFAHVPSIAINPKNIGHSHSFLSNFCKNQIDDHRFRLSICSVTLTSVAS